MIDRSALLRGVLAMAIASIVGCSGGSPAPQAPVAGSGDAAFKQLTTEILEDTFKRHPSQSTDLGIHKFDDQLDDYSAASVKAEAEAARAFKARLTAIDPATLSLDPQLDREFLLRSMDNTVLQLEVIRRWAKDPDQYPGGITNTAYVMIKRGFAPAEVRLKALIAREQGMPAVLDEARKNLDNPPKIFTEIALEQIDNNVSFFTKDVPAAFIAVKDKALLADFKKANDAVIAALGHYKTYLQKELLPKSQGSYALGAETYQKALASQEMVDVPIDKLLEIAEADRLKNEDQFQATARQLDPSKPADAVLAGLQADHPPSGALLKTTQDTLDSLRQFIVDHQIVTIPESEPAHVTETPPFMRSTTTASMDTPGPFETAKLQGFYNMTLPDPRMPRAAQDDYMKGWYYAAIVNVSVHEVYPGHYVQFLYAKSFPTDVRKVFGANTNIEGWAHYGEQMMLDEGFHTGEPKYRLAQLQDALLRNVRFIVGIKMHTQGMSVEDATKLFETQGHQPHQVAVEEAKRGAGDPLYGYYTMGKLMILKLRDDYKAKLGATYSLQGFHDAFIKIGPLPLPLIRRAMLGEIGQIF